MEIRTLTHVGKVRFLNEDRYLVKTLTDNSYLLAVCDGMGGEVAGDVAATIAIEQLQTLAPLPLPNEAILSAALQDMHLSIRDAAKEHVEYSGMGTTATVAVVREDYIYWAHAGDSRLYHYREGDIRCITQDHTVPGLLLKNGEITAEEARCHPMKNMLLNTLGGYAMQADTGRFEWHAGDVLLLSSDGLHDAVSEEQLLQALVVSDSAQSKMDMLLQCALDAGGWDNITIVGAWL